MKTLLAFIVLSSVDSTLAFVPGGFTGVYNTEQFASLMMYALMGHCLVTFLDVSTRDVHKLGTPEVFRWDVFIEKNWKRFLKNFILVYLSVRFWKDLTGREMSDFTAVIAGMSSDVIFVILKKKNDYLKKLKKIV